MVGRRAANSKRVGEERLNETSRMQIAYESVVDLTQTLGSGTAVYPGDPRVEVEEVAHLEREGFAVARIGLNDHAGTHMETQYHMTAGRRLAEEPVERFIGPAAVISAKGPRIERAALESYEPVVGRNPCVLLCTGYSDRVGGIDPSDPERPVVSAAALEWLCERGMKVFGIDAFDFDSGPPYPGHRLLFEQGVLIIEGLIGLRPLVGREVTLVALPLKVAGTGGSPCRGGA